MAQSDETLTDYAMRAYGVISRFRWVVEWALAGLALWLLAALVWTLVSPTYDREPLVRPLPMPMNTIVEASKQADRTKMVRLNPFAAGAAVELTAPETTLNLTLESLFMSTSGPLGSASIRLPNNETRVFRPGDEVLDGVYLEKILSDRVVLNRNGVQEMLLKFGRGDGFSVIDQTASADQTSAVETLGAQAELAGQARDAETLFLNVEISPVREGATIAGYRLMPRGPLDVMAAAGFVPGDILVEIDGVPVGDLDENGVVALLQDKSDVPVVVTRNGIRRLIRITFSG